MSKLPYMQFYVSDWLRDTAGLSAQARGAWIDWLCLMWHTNTGSLSGDILSLARMARIDENEAWACVEELDILGIADVEISGRNVTVTNRRIARIIGVRKSDAERKRESRVSGRVRNRSKFSNEIPEDVRNITYTSTPYAPTNKNGVRDLSGKSHAKNPAMSAGESESESESESGVCDSGIHESHFPDGKNGTRVSKKTTPTPPPDFSEIPDTTDGQNQTPDQTTDELPTPSRKILDVCFRVLGTSPAACLPLWIADHGEDHVIAALLKAEELNKKRVAYVAGILRGWATDGYPNQTANSLQTGETQEERIRRIVHSVPLPDEKIKNIADACKKSFEDKP